MANPALRRNKAATRINEQPEEQSDRILMGAAADQNSKRRRRMEDAHHMSPTLSASFSFLGVYDGHGGKTAADWCGDHVHEVLREELESCQATSGPKRVRAVEACLDRTFERCDNLILQDANIQSGCTAAVCLIDWTDHRVPYYI